MVALAVGAIASIFDFLHHLAKRDLLLRSTSLVLTNCELLLLLLLFLISTSHQVFVTLLIHLRLLALLWGLLLSSLLCLWGTLVNDTETF